MKGLRWILAFLRDPPGALGGSIATIRLRLAPLASRIRLTASEALRKAARKVALGVIAVAFALVGVGYVLIGLWLGLESLLGPRLRRLSSAHCSWASAQYLLRC